MSLLLAGGYTVCMSQSPAFVDDDVPLPPFPDAETDPPLADAAFDLILLDPTKVMLFRTGGTWVRGTISDPIIGAARTFLRVQVARAFPLFNPDQYIGLRDDKDKDIGMLQNLDTLDDKSKQIVHEELERRYFLPKVTRVRFVKEEFGTSTWEVDTDKGPRKFIVQNLRDSSQDLTSTRLLVTDKDGVRYEFPDTTTLDPKSRTILSKVQ